MAFQPHIAGSPISDSQSETDQLAPAARRWFAYRIERHGLDADKLFGQFDDREVPAYPELVVGGYPDTACWHRPGMLEEHLKLSRIDELQSTGLALTTDALADAMGRAQQGAATDQGRGTESHLTPQQHAHRRIVESRQTVDYTGYGLRLCHSQA